MKTNALRSFVDTFFMIPGKHRGEVSVTLRGDLAAFLRADAAVLSAPGNKKAALLGENGYSWEVLGSLDAGTGSHRQLRITCRA